MHRIWGSLPAAFENLEAPKGACQCRNIKHDRAPGHQTPVRPLPQNDRRKFRISYCLQAEQKKEKVSPPRRPGNLYFSVLLHSTLSSPAALRYIFYQSLQVHCLLYKTADPDLHQS